MFALNHAPRYLPSTIKQSPCTVNTGLVLVTLLFLWLNACSQKKLMQERRMKLQSKQEDASQAETGKSDQANDGNEREKEQKGGKATAKSKDKSKQGTEGEQFGHKG